MTSGPIDLERLIDAQELLSGGSQPWTFLAFSRNILNHEGVPEDLEAQEYIAAVQCEGVPVGIWIDTPTAGVTKRKPHSLRAVGHPTTSSPPAPSRQRLQHGQGQSDCTSQRRRVGRMPPSLTEQPIKTAETIAKTIHEPTTAPMIAATARHPKT